MLKLVKYFRFKDWMLFILLLLFLVAQVYADVTLPSYTSEIVSKMQAGDKSASILQTGKTMLFYAGISVICTIATTILGSLISTGLSCTLRSKVFSKVQSFNLNEINRFSGGSLITRSTNDIQQVVGAYYMVIRMAISAPLMAGWAIIKIAQSGGGELTLATAIGVVFLLAGIMTIMMITMPRFKKIQKLTDSLNGVSRENLSGLRVVRAYNAQNYQEEKFEKINTELTKTNLFNNRLMSLTSPIIMLVNYGLTLTIYWLGCFLIVRDNNAAFFPEMFAFTQLASTVIMGFMLMMLLFMVLPRAQVCAKRINEVLDVIPSITDPINPKEFISDGEIEFKDVSFSYSDGGEVLKSISFKASKGQTVAIIGATGCGKTTLLNLIPRFYDTKSGEVLLNGVNVKDVCQKDLRQKIGYVPQKPLLFSGTISENITYGKDLDNVQVETVAKISCADEFINEKTEKFDAPVAQNGSNISGGQKQRLSIARAVAKTPEIYLFDDCFSALDYKTDKEIRENLKEYVAGATKIIVAQRIGTVMNADQILVMENGSITAAGTHNELIKSSETYLEIARSQLSEEELGL